MKLNSFQSRAWKAMMCTSPRPRYAAVGGGIGNGKSLFGHIVLSHWVEYAERPFLILFGRQTMKQISESTLPEIWDEHQSWKKWYNGAKDCITFPDRRGTIMFRHLEDNPLSNINASNVLIEQGEECRQEDAMRAFKRLRRGQSQQALILYNASGHEWIWRMFTQGQWKEKHRSVCIEADSYANRENLSPEYVEFLDNMPEAERRRWVLGSHETEAGCIFSFSDLNICDSFPVPNGWPCKVIYDHGTVCPAACLVFALDKSTGITYVSDEYYRPGEIVQHAPAIKQMTAGLEVRKRIADNQIFARTGGDTVAELFEAEGIRWEPCVKSFATSKSFVNRALSEGKLMVMRHCENTIREMKEWEWKRPKFSTAIVKEQPTDGNDHTCDCVLYWGADESDKGVDLTDSRVRHNLMMQLP